MLDHTCTKNKSLLLVVVTALQLLLVILTPTENNVNAFTTTRHSNVISNRLLQQKQQQQQQQRPAFVFNTKKVKQNTYLQSTTEDQEQKQKQQQQQSNSNDPNDQPELPWEQLSEQQYKEFDMNNNNNNMVAYEVVVDDGGGGENHFDHDITLTKEYFALTNQNHIMNDEIMKLLSSELGVQQFLERSDLKKPTRDSSLIPNSSNLPLDVLLQRTLDTIEDVAVHLRRIPFEKGKQQLTKEEADTRKTICVLGSGWASNALMKVVDCRKVRLIVVSPQNHFVFTPMLASAAVGTVEYRSMSEAVRSANPCIDGRFTYII